MVLVTESSAEALWHMTSFPRAFLGEAIQWWHHLGHRLDRCHGTAYRCPLYLCLRHHFTPPHLRTANDHEASIKIYKINVL